MGKSGVWLVLLVWCLALPAAAGFGVEQRECQGHWRVEITGTASLDTGRIDRDDDFCLTGSVAYEWPLFARAVLGLKAYPLFLYHEKRDAHGQSRDIYGAGAGVGLRYYVSKAREGFFGEASIAPLWHDGSFEGNSGNFDFLSELGIGYDFAAHWHATAKWTHISNANLSEHNAGANAVGLALGYSF